MSALALIAAAPLALTQPEVVIAQAPVVQPMARAEVKQLVPPIVFSQPLAGPGAQFRIAAEGTAIVQPQAPMVQTGAVTYRLAADEASVQGPPAADPMADDIAWANAQTAQRRAQAGREGWRKIVPYEIAWQMLNALDAAQTIDCSHKPTCHEQNPLFGDRPSTGTVLGIKGGFAVIHFLLMRHIAHRNWKAARAAEIGTILVQGVIDGLNFRYAFK